jgi:flagellar basal body-associated protein FliL
MADEFSDDFLDDDDVKKPENKDEANPKNNNKVWVILVVAILQTVLAIVIVDQLVLPARAELLEANEELLMKVQQERLAIEKKIDELNLIKTGDNTEPELSEEELTGLDASKSGVMYEIKDFIINGAGEDSERLILLNLGLEFNTEETKVTMSDKEVIIRDRIINLIASKRVSDIDENNEQVQLRADIKSVLQPYLPEEGIIFNVYISNFLVQ